MANTVYPKGAEKILSGAINLQTNTIKAALVSSTYAYGATHEFVSSLGTRIGTDQTLANKSVTGGVFDADDLDFGPLPPGNTVKAIVVYQDTGNTSTSPVLLYLDSGPTVGLPFTTNGGALTVPWNDDAKKILQLGLPFYPLGGEAAISGSINFLADTLKAVALPSSYVYDPSHRFLADVPSVVGTAVTLTTKSITDGAFNADDIDLGVLAAGSILGSVLIYKDTGTPANSPLLLRITDITGFPLTTGGSNVSVRWSDGAAKIFRLTQV
jgi:hypothetical protein